MALENIRSFAARHLDMSPRRLKQWKIVSLAILIGLVIGCNYIPSTGYDWFVCWLNYVKFPTTNQFPAWIYLVISPIASLPDSWHWFNIFSGLIMAGVIWLADFPAPWLMLTLPVVWIFFYGQVDNWVALGAVLGLVAMKKNNQVLGGAAALLLMAKPHLGALLALYYLWEFRSWKMLILPGIVLLISFGVFGFWPVPYVQTILSSGVSRLVRERVNISLFPWSLALIPIIGFFWKKISPRQRATAIYAATCLIVPYVPVYSVLPLLFMVDTPFLGLLLLPAWISFGNSVIFGSLFAAGCLVYIFYSVNWKPETNPVTVKKFFS